MAQTGYLTPSNVNLAQGMLRPSAPVGLVPDPEGSSDSLHPMLPEDLPHKQHSAPITVIFMGRRGTGKSLSMTAVARYMQHAYRYARSPMRVVANYQLTFATRTSPILVDELNEFPTWGRNLLVCLDEIAAYFPGRRSLARSNVDFSTFLQQIRKRHIEIMMTTQFPQMIDNQMLMQLDLFIEVDYHRRGCSQYEGHRHCIDLYCHDWWGQWTGNNTRKPFPPYRGDCDWVKTLHNVGGTFGLYNTEEVVAPIWSNFRESIIQQTWGDEYVDEDIQEDEADSLRPPKTFTEFVNRLNYDGSGFPILSALGEAGLYDRSINNRKTFVERLKADGWTIDESIKGMPVARRG